MKEKLICPWCGSTDIGLVMGIGGSIAARCERCWTATAYHDTAKSALNELCNIAHANIGVNRENGINKENGGQENG